MLIMDEEHTVEPLFSVVIPVYNVEKYLEECVESVLQQKCAENLSLEIILVDDGSSDESGELCDQYAKTNNQIKVIHQENKGLLQARRSGFKEADGEYIINLDSDDLLVPDALQSIKRIIDEDRSDVIFYNISVMDDSGESALYTDVFTSKEGCQVTKEQVVESYFTANIPVVTSMCGKAVRKRCLDVNRDYSEYGKLSTGEDTLQTAEIIAKAESFYYLNKNLYIYRMGSGMTVQFDPDYFGSFKKILDDVVKKQGLANCEEFKDLYYEKILSTACMAIRQSKFSKEMTYSERKAFFRLLEQDKDLKEAVRKCKIRDMKLNQKMKLITQLFKMHAYLPLHLILKAIG